MGYREPDAEDLLRDVRAENERLHAKLAGYQQESAKRLGQRARAVLASFALLIGLLSLCPITLYIYRFMGRVLAYFDVFDATGFFQFFATAFVLVAGAVTVVVGVERWGKKD
jgi:hypothetical protein